VRMKESAIIVNRLRYSSAKTTNEKNIAFRYFRRNVRLYDVTFEIFESIKLYHYIARSFRNLVIRTPVCSISAQRLYSSGIKSVRTI